MSPATVSRSQRRLCRPPSVSCQPQTALPAFALLTLVSACSSEHEEGPIVQSLKTLTLGRISQAQNKENRAFISRVSKLVQRVRVCTDALPPCMGSRSWYHLTRSSSSTLLGQTTLPAPPASHSNRKTVSMTMLLLLGLHRFFLNFIFPPVNLKSRTALTHANLLIPVLYTPSMHSHMVTSVPRTTWCSGPCCNPTTGEAEARGLRIEAGLDYLVRLSKYNKGAQDVIQRQGVCLACARPWGVLSTVQTMEPNNKDQIYKSNNTKTTTIRKNQAQSRNREG